MAPERVQVLEPNLFSDKVLRPFEMAPEISFPVFVPERARVLRALFALMLIGPVMLTVAVVGLRTVVPADPAVMPMPANAMPAVPLVTLGPLVKVKVVLPRFGVPSEWIRPEPGVARSETKVVARAPEPPPKVGRVMKEVSVESWRVAPAVKELPVAPNDWASVLANTRVAPAPTAVAAVVVLAPARISVPALTVVAPV